MENHADILAGLRGLGIGLRVHAAALEFHSYGLSFHEDVPAVEGFELVDAPQEGGFAGAGRPDDAGDITLTDRQIDPFQDVKIAELLGNTSGFDHCVVHDWTSCAAVVRVRRALALRRETRPVLPSLC